MQQEEVMSQVVEILTPFVKNQAALATAAMGTSILKDLQVNSARLVDVVLEIEDRFDIQVADDEADGVRTIGDAVGLVLKKTAEA